MTKHPFFSLFKLSLLCVASLHAAYADQFEVTLKTPELNVLEYHRPYIAIWIEDKNRQLVETLTVWHEHKEPSDKWLKDLRLWWRRGGRDLAMPVDAISAATKPPGIHTVSWSDTQHLLKAGTYTLYVEAAREVGGRETLSFEFPWPISAPHTQTKLGKTELNQTTLQITPHTH